MFIYKFRVFQNIPNTWLGLIKMQIFAIHNSKQNSKTFQVLLQLYVHLLVYVVQSSQFTTQQEK